MQCDTQISVRKTNNSIKLNTLESEQDDAYAPMIQHWHEMPQENESTMPVSIHAYYLVPSRLLYDEAQWSKTELRSSETHREVQLQFTRRRAHERSCSRNVVKPTSRLSFSKADCP